jgi:PAS domain S-box-containing protein
MGSEPRQQREAGSEEAAGLQEKNRELKTDLARQAKDAEDYRFLLELYPEVTWTAAANGDILDFNQRWLELTGRSRDELLGQGWTKVSHPDDLANMQVAWFRSVKTGAPYDIEHRIRLGDGTHRWMRSRAFARHDDAGSVTKWYGFTEDIDKLKSAERRQRAIFDGTYEYIGLLSQEGILLEANRSSLEFAGIRPEDVLGKEFWNTPWFTATDGMPEQVKSGLEQAANGEFVRFEAALKRVSGEVSIFDISFHPIRDERGQVVFIVPEGRDITDLKKAEGEVRRQWELFDSALSHSPDFICAFNVDGRFTYANRSMLTWLAMNLEDLTGKRFSELSLQNELTTRLDQQIAQVTQTGERIRDDAPFTIASGDTRHYEYILAPVLDARGGVTAVLGSARDVTDRKAMEEERGRAEALLQLVINNVPGLVSYLSPEKRYRFANAKYGEWFKTDAPEGRHISEVIGADAFAMVKPHLERALQGEATRFEMLLPYDDSTPRHVQVTYMPDQQADGSIGGVVATIQDISAQKRDEEAQRASQERLQQVFAQAPVAVAVLRGPELIFELANGPYQQFFPGRELVGRPLTEAIPELEPGVRAIVQDVMRSGEAFVAHEYRVRLDRDGDGAKEDSWFTFVYQPLREAGDEVAGIVVVAVDVTTQVTARQELERLNRELEEFAFVASHDLQEPLRTVNMYSQLLLRRAAIDTPEAAKYAAFIQRGVERMEMLIRDLLNYSRTVQRDDAAPGTADLGAAFAGAREMLKSRIDETEATLDVGELPMVVGETAQFELLFENLLSNALKYRDPKRPPHIVVRSRQDGGNWEISVRDNGIGFDQQYSEKIFGLFKRLFKDEYPGTGLGLAICFRIVERYGGSMWAEGRPGSGSTFYFSLPAVEEAPQSRAS